jgi:regulator of protease activity HflC (stomatin/prohibitin superfamily)
VKAGKPSVLVLVGLGAVLVGIIVVLVLVFGSWVTIDAGHRGVVLRMGAVTGQIMGEGFNGKAPWITSVIEMEVRVQKEQVKTEGASKDLQNVSAEVAANLRIDPAKVAVLYQTVGLDYMDRIVAPAMQESIKAAIAKYTAEELITKRELVRGDIKALMVAKLEAHGIILEETNIVDFDFSRSFNDSIEAKVTAQQNALAAENKLAQVKFEAQQRIAEAEGKAKAMTVEALALQSNPAILQLRALEKWDGVLPRVTGAAVPFIDVEKVK